MFGVTVGGEAKEGVDRSKAGVAGSDAASSFLLEMIEETAHEHRVEIREVHLGGSLAGLCLGVGEEHAEGMAIRVDGVRARIALAAEPADEERLQRGSEAGHRAPSLVASTRALARANSSGTPVKYQYVEAGST
jgi:hypothetical protein